MAAPADFCPVYICRKAPNVFGEPNDPCFSCHHPHYPAFEVLERRSFTKILALSEYRNKAQKRNGGRNEQRRAKDWRRISVKKDWKKNIHNRYYIR
jgi:hypothetical protein